MQSRTWVLLFVLLALLFLCYGNTINNGFVWDDNYLIKYNPLIRAPILSPYRFIQDIANSHFRKSDYYRPLQILSYALDYRIYGFKPFGYHLSNILLHCAGAFLAFFLTLKLCGNKYLSIIVAMLFSVFPANISAISYISGRADLLYVCFGLLSMYFFVLLKEKKRTRFLIFSGVSLVLSFLSKESAVIFPFILIFMDFFVYGKKQFKIQNHFLSMGILCFYIAGNILLRGGVSVISSFGMTFSGFFSSFAYMLVTFLKAVFLPFNISVRSSINVLRLYDYGLVLLILSFMGLIAVFEKKNKHIILFSFIIFMLALAPFVLGMIKLKVIGYHWLYLASYSFFLFVSLALYGFLKNRGVFFKRVVAFMGIILIGIYSTIVICKNSIWEDDISLSDMVGSEASEDATPLRFKYTELLFRGENDKVLELSKKDIEENPEDPHSWTLRGVMLLEVGKALQARKSFERAMELDPFFSEAYIGLARVSMSEDKEEEAIMLLEKAIDINSKNQKAYIFVTPLYSKKGLLKDALISAQKAVDLNPYNYNALINLGSVYLQTGQAYEGTVQYLKAAKLYPEKPLAYYNLGSVFYYSGNEKEAEKWINKALIADPGYDPAVKVMKLIRE